ncbi:MAG: DUF3995 domain-containing protein [Rhodoglobus sp.]
MNIRTRTVAGFALIVALLLLAALHVGWAVGSPFPAATFGELTRAVVPLPAFPGTFMTLAVAAGLVIACVGTAFRTIDLRRSPAKRSNLLRLGVYATATLFALRAVAGFLVSSGIVAESPANPVFTRWDLTLYSPLCALLALAGFVLAGQSRLPQDLFAHALTVFRRVPFVQLVTLDELGAPRSRVVMRLRVEGEGVVWIATSTDSRKVEDIRRDPRVSLSVFDSAALAMASLEGTAEIVDDQQLLKRHWMAGLKLYFTDGQKDGRYTLLRITPTTFGLSDFSLDITPEPFGLCHVSQAAPNAQPARI